MAPTTRRPPPPPEGGRRSTRESNPSPMSHGTIGGPSPIVNAAVAGGRLNGFVERASAEVVGVTYWFTPAPAPVHQSVTLRFTGRRLDIDGSPSPRDQFVHDELVSDILAGSGPVAVTAKIGDVNSGQWDVRAKMLPAGRPVRPGRGRKAESVPGPLPVYPASWSWRHWRLTKGDVAPVSTCPSPLVPAPGIVIGAWAILALLGSVVALVTQRLVISADRLALGHRLPISLAALLAGVVGAKLWYVALQRRQRRRDGWCIQGLVVGFGLVAPVLLVAAGHPVGVFLDATVPGLLFAMAIGRLGCFFAGCCCGRPTSSRWGVWSSDRRLVGVRRIPTQLIEAGFTLLVGLATLVAVLEVGAAGGGWFVAGLATYTIGRQGILHWRVDRKSPRARLITAAIATVILVVDLSLVVFGAI